MYVHVFIYAFIEQQLRSYVIENCHGKTKFMLDNRTIIISQYQNLYHYQMPFIKNCIILSLVSLTQKACQYAVW